MPRGPFAAARSCRLLLLGLTAWLALASPAVSTLAQGAACPTGIMAATLVSSSEVPPVQAAGAARCD